jgi:hypothetical protein
MTMPSNANHDQADFFISYNSADQQWAQWIAWVLEQAGYKTIIQAWDFRPGSNFVLEMQQAATRAERVIAALSPEYLGANFSQPEWAAAFAQDPQGIERRLVPCASRSAIRLDCLGRSCISISLDSM